MSQKKQSLISGVAILGIAGIISKVIGMFYRIPLGDMLQASGYGIYMGVYPTYTMLLTISTAGIPVAISRLVAENVTLSRHCQARAILRVSLLLLSAIGLALTLLLIALSRPIAVLTGDPETALGFCVIAPSILIVSVMSALRGYMQGRSRMAPTAVSQIIEQVAKVIIAFPLASIGMQRYGVVYGATGALMGITIGEACALCYMVIVYMRSRKGYIADERRDRRRPRSNRQLASQIIRLAIPITIGSMIVPISGFIDSAMIRVRLGQAGFDMEQARALYGMLTGHSLSLVNVPTVFATAVCIGLVPVISGARIEKRYRDMRETSRLGLRLGSLIGFPCSVGMSLLAEPIIRLLYPNLPVSEIVTTGRILTIQAWTIIFFTMVQASTGILQGMGLHKVPMLSLVAGVGLKIVLNYTLVGLPGINVFGAPVASIACYTLSMVINIGYIVKRGRMRFHWGMIVWRPALATLGMAATVLLCEQVLDMTRRFSALIAVGLGVLVYLVLVFVVGALRQKDMAQIPGGARIEGLMRKLRIWR